VRLVSGECWGVSVLRINIVSASAKVNTGPAGEDPKDLQNEEVTSKVWAGVLPVWEHIGSPVKSKTNKVTPVPKYLNSWMEEQNASREEYAVGVASNKL